MKKTLIATGIAVLAFATVVAAQGYVFNANLSVGSTGPGVVALQTWLVANSYHIPAIESGAAAKGYFGSQTKAAVMQYQAAHGIPNTGFVGPLTRASLNGGAGVVTGPVNCPAGFTCTANPGTTVPVTPAGPTGITTPGVQGILTITQGPVSSAVLNVGQTMVPVLTVRAQAQYSDVAIQSIQLDLGTNTGIYNKIFRNLYITNGASVLATIPLSSATVVQSGSTYIVGLGGFNVIVPRGTYKDIVVKADLNSSIDSTYTGTGSKVPGSQTVAGTTVTGWAIGLGALSVRGVDGAGINLYGPASGFAQAYTINTSLVDTAQANISLDAASPLVANIPVNDTTNGQYLGLPVLVFDVNAQNDTLHLHEVKVRIYKTAGGTGSASAAYLYQGSTLITSASVSSGLATFTNITNGTAGATIPLNSTLPYTVKVDVTGVTSGSAIFTAGVATSTTGDLTIYNSQDGTATIAGSATGNAQTVAAAGPLFTLVGSPTIVKNNITAGNGAVTIFQYAATFNVNILAVGQDVLIGLPASTTANSASFGSSTTGINVAQLYENGVASTTGPQGGLVASYTQPSNTTLTNNTFTVSRNQSVTIPVTYSFIVNNPAAATEAVQLQGIYYNGSQIANFMANQPAWRTSAI